MTTALLTVLVMFLAGIVSILLAGYIVDRRREQEHRRDLLAIKNICTTLVNQNEDEKKSRIRLENLMVEEQKDIEAIKMALITGEGLANLSKGLDGMSKGFDKLAKNQHNRDWRSEWLREVEKLSPSVRKEILEDDRAYEKLKGRKRPISESIFREAETLANRGA